MRRWLEKEGRKAADLGPEPQPTLQLTSCESQGDALTSWGLSVLISRKIPLRLKVLEDPFRLQYSQSLKVISA